MIDFRVEKIQKKIIKTEFVNCTSREYVDPEHYYTLIKIHRVFGYAEEKPIKISEEEFELLSEYIFKKEEKIQNVLLKYDLK